MTNDARLSLVEDIIKGIAGGAVAESVPALTVQRRDDGTVLEVDLGDPDLVYIVTVTAFERVD